MDTILCLLEEYPGELCALFFVFILPCLAVLSFASWQFSKLSPEAKKRAAWNA